MSRRKTPPHPPAPPAAPNPPKRKYIRKEKRPFASAGVVPHRGSLRKSEKSTLDSIISSVQGELVPAQIDGLALAMKREPATIAKYVQNAKEKFNSAAERYAEIHLASAE
jgi:hypothetical protein